MIDRRVTAELSRDRILEQIVMAERETQQLRAAAAQLTPDLEDLAVRGLAGHDIDALKKLIAEEERREAEAFVQQAIEV